MSRTQLRICSSSGRTLDQYGRSFSLNLNKIRARRATPKGKSQTPLPRCYDVKK